MLGLEMQVPDVVLVRELEARDGPLGSYWRPHSAEGVCRYVEHYGAESCPWCEAEARRIEREKPAEEAAPS